MTNDQAIEATCACIAAQLEDALRKLCGGDRGFVIMVFKSAPSEPGDGILLSNIESEHLPALISDAVETMSYGDDDQPQARH